ncbi:MAG: ATP cone domain-containing protein [Candidatus Zambryskibacteria bacterium]|nr:ATP cone domain-containing protein [Candidatus Zambryskibacteria bacterium]
MNTDIFITKADGTREKFDVAKLENSLKKAGAGAKVAEDIISNIQNELTDGITTLEIYRKAFDLLHKEEKPIALKYSLKRAIMELGPSGFPFEKFIAEIFKYKGYTAETGKIVKGFCVEHEVDVVAWNDQKLIMCEAKFHNDPGMKSDLKIALYVKARFDDLRQMTFKYGKERKLDEGWLITNTKFSSTAIEYGSCQGGLIMVGWNYPPRGNLHDLVLEAKLHPVTCLTSLSGREKKFLIQQNMVLCKSITENPGILPMLGLSPVKIKKVLLEIEML